MEQWSWLILILIYSQNHYCCSSTSTLPLCLSSVSLENLLDYSPSLCYCCCHNETLVYCYCPPLWMYYFWPSEVYYWPLVWVFCCCYFCANFHWPQPRGWGCSGGGWWSGRSASPGLCWGWPSSCPATREHVSGADTWSHGAVAEISPLAGTGYPPDSEGWHRSWQSDCLQN